MQPYREFAPTAFDARGAFLDDRQDWLVVPVGQTRDSGPLPQSNFASAEKMLEEADPDCEDHEKHSFNHWGPGWFEILIVRPESTCEHVATEIEAGLENYPVLDDEDFSEREYTDMEETWRRMSMHDRINACSRSNGSIFAARRDEIPHDWPYHDELRSDY